MPNLITHLQFGASSEKCGQHKKKHTHQIQICIGKGQGQRTISTKPRGLSQMCKRNRNCVCDCFCFDSCNRCTHTHTMETHHIPRAHIHTCTHYLRTTQAHCELYSNPNHLSNVLGSTNSPGKRSTISRGAGRNGMMGRWSCVLPSSNCGRAGKMTSSDLECCGRRFYNQFKEYNF